MKIELSYTTKLEAIAQNDDVSAILDAKLQATSPAQVTDYVALALDHIKAKQDEIANAIKSLQELKKHEGARAEHIKEQVCNWIEGMGIDKLDGLITSSMTVNVAKPKEELVILNEEALINSGYFKTVIDTSMVKKALQDGIEVEGAKLDVVHVADKIQINKKRS